MTLGIGAVAIPFSDIEGSTAMTERLGDQRWLELLACAAPNRVARLILCREEHAGAYPAKEAAHDGGA